MAYAKVKTTSMNKRRYLKGRWSKRVKQAANHRRRRQDKQAVRSWDS